MISEIVANSAFSPAMPTCPPPFVGLRLAPTDAPGDAASAGYPDRASSHGTSGPTSATATAADVDDGCQKHGHRRRPVPFANSRVAFDCQPRTLGTCRQKMETNAEAVS